MTRWFVIGIGGATCSGKTSLAAKLHEALENSQVIHQDSYFLAENDPRHIHDEELNHHNWDIITSVDMEKMHRDILKIITSKNDAEFDEEQRHVRVLILDGIFLFNYQPIAELCDAKYFLTLTKDDCWNRRCRRVYDPPDVPGYFEKIVWPEYERYRKEIENDEKLGKDIVFIDGMADQQEIYKRVFMDIPGKFKSNKVI